MDLKDGLWQDVLTIVRLIGVCFGNHGIAGCLCQFTMTLQPEWRKQSENAKVRCTNGDPWEIMADQVDSQIVGWAEWGVNFFITAANSAIYKAFEFAGAPRRTFKHVCWNTAAEPDRCPVFDLPELRECENENLKGGLDLVCYYHRVNTICSNIQLTAGYASLFTDGFQDFDSLQSQFAAAFGDSYEMLDPTLLDLMKKAKTSTLSGPDMTDRREICDEDAFFNSMKLDQIVRACSAALILLALTSALYADRVLFLCSRGEIVPRGLRRRRKL